MLKNNILNNVVKIIDERVKKTNNNLMPQLQDELEIEVKKDLKVITKEIYK